MKKQIFALVIAVVCGGAWSQQWTKTGMNDVGTVFYVDPTTIKINGNLRRFWVLAERASPDQDGDLSYRAVEEVDCQEERQRYLQWDYFRGSMGRGERSGGSNTPGGWNYAAPGTINAIVLKFVCSR